MGTAMFFSFMGSLIICMALIPALSLSAWRLQFIDVPRERHAHSQPIAKVGGIAFALATFAAVLVWAPKDATILASLLGGFIILLFGMWDDRVGLLPGAKLVGQVLAAVTVIGLAGVRLSAVPFFDDVPLSAWLSVPVTCLVIVAVTNAVNLSDGLDGLAGGLSVISFAGIAYLAYRADESLLVLLMAAVLGGLLGFLRFNTHPARIFMGDAGSQFLGHYLAVAAILLTDPARTAYSPMLAPFLWGVPLLDTVGVVIQRLRERRSPFVGDRNHLHHKLLRIGLTHGQAVTVIYALHGAMVGCAYLFRWESDGVLLALYACFATIVLSLFWGTGGVVRLPVAARPRPAGVISPNMRTWLATTLGVLVPMYLLAALAIPRTIPRDVGLVAAGLLAALLGSAVVGRGTVWVVRAGLYIGSTFVVYYSETTPGFVPIWLWKVFNVGFVGLAVLVALSMRHAGEQRFQTTPLDYMILGLAATMSFLPGLGADEVPVGMMASKLVVLFFAFEILLSVRAATIARLEWVSAGVLAVLVVRSWW